MFMKMAIRNSQLRFSDTAKDEIDSIVANALTESHNGDDPYELRRFRTREALCRLERRYFKNEKYDLVGHVQYALHCVRCIYLDYVIRECFKPSWCRKRYGSSKEKGGCINKRKI